MVVSEFIIEMYSLFHPHPLPSEKTYLISSIIKLQDFNNKFKNNSVFLISFLKWILIKEFLYFGVCLIFVQMYYINIIR